MEGPMLRLASVIFLFGSMITAAPVSAQPNVGPKQIHAMCAAANAMASVRMPPGMLTDLIQSEAKRHADVARKFGASHGDLEQVVMALTLAYNQKTLTWATIVDVAHGCTNQ
jgi:hypothetical protein